MNLHQANILIVDDDKDVLTAVRFFAEDGSENNTDRNKPGQHS